MMKPIMYMLIALLIFKIVEVMFLDDALAGLSK
jgi:hypothetical protein